MALNLSPHATSLLPGLEHVSSMASLWMSTVRSGTGTGASVSSKESLVAIFDADSTDPMSKPMGSAGLPPSEATELEEKQKGNDQEKEPAKEDPQQDT